MAKFRSRVGKVVLQEVLKKVKKSFIAKHVSKKAGAKLGQIKKKAEEKEKAGEGEKAGDEEKAEKDKEVVEKEKDEKEKGEGPLTGKLVRVVDETSHVCGHLVEVLGHAGTKLNGHIAWKDVTGNFLDKAKVPPKVHLDEKQALPLDDIPQPKLTVWKHLKLKDEERVEAEILFNPTELEVGYKLYH